jgi:proton glutamate symport protein
MSETKKLALHWQILIGLAAGLVVGLAVNLAQGPLQSVLGDTGLLRALATFVVQLNSFVGDLFLRGLQFIAVPIVLFSLITGASSLNDIQKLSRIGGATVTIYLFTTALAISIGLVLANLIAPGSYVSAELRDSLANASASSVNERISAAVAPDAWATLLDLVSKNPFASLAQGNMLQVVFAALAIGVALSMIPEEKAKPVLQLSDAMNEVVIKLVQIIMLAAPYAVFALLARVMANMGLEVLGALVAYSLTVLIGLALMLFVVYPAFLIALTPISYRRFFDAIAPAQLLAFSSSSSSATLPVTMECVEHRLGVPEQVTSFVVPLGATVNMDGTALYQGVAAMFIAQMYGIDLTFSDQLTIVLTATLASVGTAGVPGVGLVMLVVVLQSVNLPSEVMRGGIAVIFGVDRLLDMARTTCNITGDCMTAAVIGHREGGLLTAEEVERRWQARTAGGLDQHPPDPA